MTAKPRKLHRNNWWYKNWPYLMLTLPGIAVLFLMHTVPLYGLIMAFKDYNFADGVWGSPWNGFENFKYFFTSNDAWRVIRNTVGYNLIFMFAVNIGGGALIALLLYEVRSKWTIKAYQTSLLLPSFISWVIVAYIGVVLFNPVYGLLNKITSAIGLGTISWYNEPKYWPFILVIFEFWKNAGMASLYYYSALLNIDSSLFEAAELDGAGRFKQIIHISLPEMIPMTCILLITKMGTILGGANSDYGIFYQLPMDSGPLYPATDVLGTYMLRGLESGDYGATTAVGLAQSVVGIILVLISNSIMRKISPENAMF